MRNDFKRKIFSWYPFELNRGVNDLDIVIRVRNVDVLFARITSTLEIGVLNVE